MRFKLTVVLASVLTVCAPARAGNVTYFTDRDTFAAAIGYSLTVYTGLPGTPYTDLNPAVYYDGVWYTSPIDTEIGDWAPPALAVPDVQLGLYPGGANGFFGGNQPVVIKVGIYLTQVAPTSCGKAIQGLRSI